MADIERLRKMVKQFKINARPSMTCGSEPCTVDDLRKLIECTSKVMNAIVDEMEQLEYEHQ